MQTIEVSLGRLNPPEVGTLHIDMGTGEEIARFDSEHVTNPMSVRERALNKMGDDNKVDFFVPPPRPPATPLDMVFSEMSGEPVSTGDQRQIYKVRIRCDFSPSLPDDLQEQVSDILHRNMSTEFAIPNQRENRYFTIDSRSFYNEDDATALMNKAIEHALDTRRKWWQSPEGKTHAHRERMVIADTLPAIDPWLDPYHRVMAEDAFAERLDRLGSRWQTLATNKKAAAINFYVNDPDLKTELGNIGAIDCLPGVLDALGRMNHRG